jgi:hypothetical protein
MVLYSRFMVSAPFCECLGKQGTDKGVEDGGGEGHDNCAKSRELQGLYSNRQAPTIARDARLDAGAPPALK